MSNGAPDVNAGDSGINWLGRNSISEVVDVSGAGSLRLRKVAATYDQFTLDAGIGAYVTPTIYSLQPGDWIYLVQVLVTEDFNDSNVPGAVVAVHEVISNFAISVDSSPTLPPVWTGGNVGLANADGGNDAEVYSALDPHLPITPYPGGSAVDFRLVAGLAGDGTAGSLEVLFWVAEF